MIRKLREIFYSVPNERFTHYGFFYCIPVFVNFNCGEIAGRNFVFDYLLTLALAFHNEVTERVCQFVAATRGWVYEPGFQVLITGEIEQ